MLSFVAAHDKIRNLSPSLIYFSPFSRDKVMYIALLDIIYSVQRSQFLISPWTWIYHRILWISKRNTWLTSRTRRDVEGNLLIKPIEFLTGVDACCTYYIDAQVAFRYASYYKSTMNFAHDNLLFLATTNCFTSSFCSGLDQFRYFTGNILSCEVKRL